MPYRIEEYTGTGDPWFYDGADDEFFAIVREGVNECTIGAVRCRMTAEAIVLTLEEVEHLIGGLEVFEA